MDRYQVQSMAFDAVDPVSLVAAGKVHSRLYIDTAIFELEMERIFHRTWVYIGHSSEVPVAGDFRTRRIGRQPVIMIRGSDDKIRVLMNRCRHRAAAVTDKEAGNTKYLRCWFHGWVYDTTGKLVEVTSPGGYGPDFDKDLMGLTPAPRVEEYRGFVFAKLDPSGPSLRQHLGKAADRIDLLVDAAPDGEVLVDAGVNRTVYRGNWKLVGMDGYHPNFTHASVVDAWRRRQDSGLAATHRDDPFSDTSSARTCDLGNGHVMLDFTEQRLGHFPQYKAFLEKFEGGADYIRRIFEKFPEDRAKLIVALAGDPHIGIYPNMQIINNQVRIVNPIAPDETEVVMFAVRLKGMSDALNAERLRQHESFYGPASSGSPDDAEIFERTQRGLMAQVEPWVNISRGMNRERHEPDGTITGFITDEVTQRGQIRRWLELVTGAEA